MFAGPFKGPEVMIAGLAEFLRRYEVNFCNG